MDILTAAICQAVALFLLFLAIKYLIIGFTTTSSTLTLIGDPIEATADFIACVGPNDEKCNATFRWVNPNMESSLVAIMSVKQDPATYTYYLSSTDFYTGAPNLQTLTFYLFSDGTISFATTKIVDNPDFVDTTYYKIIGFILLVFVVILMGMRLWIC